MPSYFIFKKVRSDFEVSSRIFIKTKLSFIESIKRKIILDI